MEKSLMTSPDSSVRSPTLYCWCGGWFGPWASAEAASAIRQAIVAANLSMIMSSSRKARCLVPLLFQEFEDRLEELHPVLFEQHEMGRIGNEHASFHRRMHEVAHQPSRSSGNDQVSNWPAMTSFGA